MLLLLLLFGVHARSQDEVGVLLSLDVSDASKAPTGLRTGVLPPPCIEVLETTLTFTFLPFVSCNLEAPSKLDAVLSADFLPTLEE